MTFDEWFEKNFVGTKLGSYPMVLEAMRDSWLGGWEAALDAERQREEVRVTNCVLKSWVVILPMMQQTVLMTAVRGPDGVSKRSPVKSILRVMRATFIHNAKPLEQGEFMTHVDDLTFTSMLDSFLADVDMYPMHFLMHFTHAAEIIGYKCEHLDQRLRWQKVYLRMVELFHLNAETHAALDARLGS
jgi:hypothetical protein